MIVHVSINPLPQEVENPRRGFLDEFVDFPDPVVVLGDVRPQETSEDRLLLLAEIHSRIL